MFSRTKNVFSSFGFKSSSISELVRETQTLICEKDWIRESGFQKTIETNLGILRNVSLQDDPYSYASDKQVFAKIDELYKRLQVFQEEKKSGISYKSTPFTVHKIEKTVESVTTVKDIAKKWKAEAIWKEYMALTQVTEASEYKQILARYSVEVWDGVIKHIERPSMSVYVASELNGAIQGIALTEVENSTTHLRLLGTNPDNILLLGHEKNMLNRVGSKLILEVVQDILSNSSLRKILQLEASSTAMDFYRKLGFTEKFDSLFELDEEGMIKLTTMTSLLKI